MYLEHFGLQEFPFSLAPDPRYLYLSAQHREALAHLLYGVRSDGGFVQLTGEVGTGKTTVCRCFLEQLPPGTRAAVILNPGLTAEELLATICDEFEIERPGGPPGVKESVNRLQTFLLDVHAGGGRAVLVVDEAQNLDPAVLEQVRLLTNLETSHHKLLQIVLMGQPELRATLARPDLRQLNQRITARFHLGPLTRAETAAYVRHRLGVGGCNEELFPAAVLGRLWRLSRGVPRLVNILCDRALLGSYAQGRHAVDRPTLEKAAAEVSGDVRSPGLPWRAAAVLAGVLVAAIGFSAMLRSRPTGVPPVATQPAAVAAPVAVSTSGAPRAGVPTARRTGVSGVLRALMDEPGAQSEEEAWRWLYRLWGIRPRPGQNGCAQALVHGLDCLRGQGGLEQLRRLDRPAILRVYDPQGAERWLVVERMQERLVTLVAGGARTVVDVGRLESYDLREFVALWRPPEDARGSLAAGDEGAGVIWLARQLGAPEPVDAAFDDELAGRVRVFQRAAGLAEDGVAGPETLVLLDRDPAPGTPTLGRPR